MNTKALWSVAVLGTVATFFSACGDGDSTKIKICNAKQITCLNDEGGQICSADGTTTLAFQCGEGQRCCDPHAKDAECGDDVKAATCVGACNPGDTQCGSKGVSLRCSDDGRSWVPTECPVGTGCDMNKESDTYGTCVNSDDPEDVVVVCTGGDKSCADGKTAKECEADGTNWVYTACAENEVCDDGVCEVDPAKGCVPHSGTCVDKTHVKLCNDDGDAYDKTEECPDETTCEDGACQGPVCAVGAIRCDDVRVGPSFGNAIVGGTYQAQAVYHCNDDGTAWELSTCAANEICVYDNISASTVNKYVADLLSSARSIYGLLNLPTLVAPSSSRGSCQVPGCASPFALRTLGVLLDQDTTGTTAGSFTCGDGTKPGEDTLDSYSLCEGLPPFNNLYWANYVCPENETCIYEGAPSSVESADTIIGPTCSSQCVPGTVACTSLGNGTVGGTITTVGEATVTCASEGSNKGTWDFTTLEKCHDGARELWCGPNLQGTKDNYNVGTCMEPACAAWFTAFDTFTLPEGVGACGTDGKFYPCQADGTFGDPEACSDCQLASGVTLPYVSTAAETFAGYDPGQCMKCAPEAQRCVFPSGQTPYYQRCNANGQWGTETCSEGDLCWDYQDQGNGLPSIVCGGECAPFTATCGGDDGKQIAQCDANGKLGDFAPCKTGACHTDTVATESGSLGSAVCESECINGTFQCADTLTEVACKNERYDVLNPTDCSTDDLQNPERCIDKLGCVECDPGTFSGRPQVRCALDADGAPVVPAAVQVCDKNGHWDDAVECPGSGTSCYAGICSSTGPAPGEGGNGGQTGTSGTGGAP